jgi:hypothetical protein
MGIYALFTDVSNEVQAYNGGTLLVVADRKQQYGENWFVCVTDAAREQQLEPFQTEILAKAKLAAKKKKGVVYLGVAGENSDLHDKYAALSAKRAVLRKEKEGYESTFAKHDPAASPLLPAEVVVPGFPKQVELDDTQKQYEEIRDQLEKATLSKDDDDEESRMARIRNATGEFRVPVNLHFQRRGGGGGGGGGGRAASLNVACFRQAYARSIDADESEVHITSSTSDSVEMYVETRNVESLVNMVTQIESQNYKKLYDNYQETQEEHEDENACFVVDEVAYAIEMLAVYSAKPFIPRPYRSEHMERTLSEVDGLTVKVHPFFSFLFFHPDRSSALAFDVLASLKCIRSFFLSVVVCLPVCLSTCLPACLSVCLFVNPSITSPDGRSFK